MDLYMKEREGKPNADCQSRSPKPEPNAEYQFRAVLVAMGAGEADRGKRGRQRQARPMGQARLVGAAVTGGGRLGWWGQARPMGAVSRRAKSLVNRAELTDGAARIHERSPRCVIGHKQSGAWSLTQVGSRRKGTGGIGKGNARRRWQMWGKRRQQGRQKTLR